jgi:hypothetical protein
MRTPAGRECRYFYGDYFRGRKHEECRLLDSTNPPLQWSADLCFTCPVPQILLANACEHLVLEPELVRPFPFVKRKVNIKASCTKTQRAVEDPYIGCGECHPIDPLFLGDTGDSNPAH